MIRTKEEENTTEKHHIQVKQLRISREALLGVRVPAIVKKYGPMPVDMKHAFDRALATEDINETHKAMVIIDRWRFVNHTREEQLFEQSCHRENYENALREGRRGIVHPDDLVDLIHPEGVDQSTITLNPPVSPPDGFKSLPSTPDVRSYSTSEVE